MFLCWRSAASLNHSGLLCGARANPLRGTISRFRVAALARLCFCLQYLRPALLSVACLSAFALQACLLFWQLMTVIVCVCVCVCVALDDLYSRSTTFELRRVVWKPAALPLTRFKSEKRSMSRARSQKKSPSARDIRSPLDLLTSRRESFALSESSPQPPKSVSHVARRSISGTQVVVGAAKHSPSRAVRAIRLANTHIQIPPHGK